MHKRFVLLVATLLLASTCLAFGGSNTANGWYKGEEIYYLDKGVEGRLPDQGWNDIYLIGGNRMYQANVVEFIPGNPGYSPHWDVSVVHTADGVTLSDIVASPYVSEQYGTEGVLFDKVEDILGAAADGLVTITEPGVIVLCPIISEQAADAPGNNPLSEEFLPFPETF
jgi:predicted small secreted protein